MSQGEHPDKKYGTCPFLGMVVMPQVQKGVLTAKELDIQMVVNKHYCINKDCALWNAKAEACSVKLGMDAIVELKGKLGLASLFGGGKPNG